MTAPHTPSEKAAPALHAKRSLDAIKSDVCDTTLRVMAWLVIPAVLVSISRALDIGWTAQYNGQIGGAVLVWVITLYRHRLPYAVRANLILLLLIGMGWSGQINTTAPTSYVYYASASAMAAVFYGARAGVAFIVLSVVLTFSTFFAIKAGMFPIPTYAAGMSITTWISRSASLIIAAAGPVIAITRFSAKLMQELERAEATSDAKSSFLATMSHELRTPMTAIIGTAELLQDDKLPSEQARKVDRIARAGKNLLSLLNDLLDFAKIEAEQMPIDKAAFSLNDTLGEVRDLFSPLADEKGLKVRIDNRAARDGFIGDAARLRQILNNLVGNAVKFTEKGEIVIAAEDEDVGPDRATLKLSVIDAGMGISSADQTRLFEPFVQAQNFRSRSHGGTGLGLTISRRLAAKMGGALTLVSELGKGSTFTLTLTLPLSHGPVAARAETREPTTAGRRGLRVLLAEDNDAIRDLMSEMVARRGHAIDCAGNGREALNALQVRPYDVVIMDMHMPVMDGAEATRAIRALSSSVAGIPIIALTAGLTEDQRAAYLQAGVNHVVAKPAHWPTLFDAIESRGLTFREAAAPAPSSNAPLDESLLVELEGAIGPEAMRAALESFRAGVVAYEQQLQAALASSDTGAAHRIGHAIKGACLQFGASEVARLGARIEAKATSLDEMKSAAAEIPAAFARFNAALSRRAAA